MQRLKGLAPSLPWGTNNVYIVSIFLLAYGVGGGQGKKLPKTWEDAPSAGLGDFPKLTQYLGLETASTSSFLRPEFPLGYLWKKTPTYGTRGHGLAFLGLHLW